MMAVWQPTSELWTPQSCVSRLLGPLGLIPSSSSGKSPDFGSSTLGMPPLQAYEGSDGALELYDGVQRAITRRSCCLEQRFV